MMKSAAVLLIGLAGLCGCQSDSTPKANENADLTGNTVTYELSPASVWDIHGTAIFHERKDGSTLVQIKLQGLDDRELHPAHLHFGDVSVDKAQIAIPLHDVDGSTGTSNTVVKMLSDETPVTYETLKNFDGCIKIHLAADGDGANIILAGGNIGSAITKTDIFGRAKIGVCQSQ